MNKTSTLSITLHFIRKLKINLQIAVKTLIYNLYDVTRGNHSPLRESTASDILLLLSIFLFALR